MNRKKETEKHEADETVYDGLESESAQPAVVAAPVDAPADKKEVDALKDRLLRLQADFDNFRKRSARERSEWQSFAIEQLVLALLPVVDHYELGLAMAEKQKADPSVLDGLKLVYEQLVGVLKKQGVTFLSAEPGSVFDPHQHEAIAHVPSDEHAADVIIAETRRGYKLGEKMIRPMQVVVSSGAAEESESNGN